MSLHLGVPIWEAPDFSRNHRPRQNPCAPMRTTWHPDVLRNPLNVLQNMVLVERLKALAEKQGCTPAQMALAWVHAQVHARLARP